MHDLPNLALSIRQPWAWAILCAGKDIENRDWRTSFRGPVCIHAAKGMTRDEFLSACDFIVGDLQVRPVPPDPQLMERGGIVGTARIADCVSESRSPWFVGRYGFVLADVKPVPFIPVKGALGFFEWRERVIPEPERERVLL